MWYKDQLAFGGKNIEFWEKLFLPPKSVYIFVNFMLESPFGYALILGTVGPIHRKTEHLILISQYSSLKPFTVVSLCVLYNKI